MKNSRNLLILLTVSLLLSATLACIVTAPLVTPTLAPTSTPLWQALTLDVVPYHETGQAPDYTLDAQTPVLQGSQDPRVVRFNQEVDALVQDEIATFKQWLADVPVPPLVGGSFFDESYTSLAGPGDLISLRFDIMTYFDGAAHPGTHSRTLTYNLATGADISLSQLFQPGSNYLDVIASYCKAQLSTRDIAFDMFSTGADPTEENYRNWNITPDGLLITFDEYQVAAYAAGRQEVVIPYSDLQTILDSNGPLGNMSR